MTAEELLEALRAATEDDVAKALTDAMVALPIKTEVEALELFNCVLDAITGERDAAEIADDEAIAAALARRRDVT